MWTLMDSPVGELRIVEQDGAITAIEFAPYPDLDGRPRGDRDDVRLRLLEIPGIGPWTADYVAMRALGHPDVFLPTDLGIRDALRALGRDPTRAAVLAQAWRPWRSYAQLHLWQTLEALQER